MTTPIKTYFTILLTHYLTLMKILILHNSPLPNRTDDADTLQQVAEITAALKALKHEVIVGAVDSLTEIEDLLNRHQPQLVFNLVESFLGSDKNINLIPEYLESKNMAYTGCTAVAMLLTGDKVAAKKIMQKVGIPTPAYFDEGFAEGQIEETLQMIVKSKTEHASFGMDADSVVVGAMAAKNLMQKKAEELDGQWLAEQYIDGREFNVSVIGRKGQAKILPLAEIVFSNFAANTPKIVDYAAKWDESSHAYHNTARRFVDEDTESILVEKIKNITLKCWAAFDLCGYARVDFRVDAQGNPWVLEINANPCLTRDAGFIAAAAEAGMDYIQIINHIMEVSNHDFIKEPASITR
jgi:D-alanine-D-alanine ligase